MCAVWTRFPIGLQLVVQNKANDTKLYYPGSSYDFLMLYEILFLYFRYQFLISWLPVVLSQQATLSNEEHHLKKTGTSLLRTPKSLYSYFFLRRCEVKPELALYLIESKQKDSCGLCHSFFVEWVSNVRRLQLNRSMSVKLQRLFFLILSSVRNRVKGI